MKKLVIFIESLQSFITLLQSNLTKKKFGAEYFFVFAK